MDWVVFRPLRTQTPAVMLVATFAVAFLLQSIALLWFGSLGKIAASLSSLNQPWTVGGVDIRKISIVATAVAAGCLVLATVAGFSLNPLMRSRELPAARAVPVEPQTAS